MFAINHTTYPDFRPCRTIVISLRVPVTTYVPVFIPSLQSIPPLSASNSGPPSTHTHTYHLSKHLLELSLSCGLLGVIVASEVVALDENIGDGPLSRKLQKSILDGIAVVHLVQLNDLGIDSLVKEQVLGLAAKWAERL